MKLHIPVAPIHAGLFVGSCVYVVANTTGDVTGFVVSKSLKGINTAISNAALIIAGPHAAFISYQILDQATETYFIPALKTGTKGTAAVVAAASAVIAAASVAVLWEGGKWIAKKLITYDSKQEPMEIDFISWDSKSDDFIIINTPFEIEDKDNGPQTL